MSVQEIPRVTFTRELAKDVRNKFQIFLKVVDELLRQLEEICEEVPKAIAVTFPIRVD